MNNQPKPTTGWCLPDNRCGKSTCPICEAIKSNQPKPVTGEQLPCGCTIEPDDAMKSSVFWNPFNNVVQCHKCGHVYEPKAYPKPTRHGGQAVGEWTHEKLQGLLQISNEDRYVADWSFENTLDEINAALAAERELADIGRKWKTDSSLETWFPFTAEEIQKLRSQLAAAQAAIVKLKDVVGKAPIGIHVTRLLIEEMNEVYSDTTALYAAIDEAVKGVSVIRCIKHINVPQINTTEITGAECGVCAFDKGAAAAQQPLVDLLRGVHEWFMKQAPEHYNGCGLWIDVDATLKDFAKVKEGK